MVTYNNCLGIEFTDIRAALAATERGRPGVGVAVGVRLQAGG